MAPPVRQSQSWGGDPAVWPAAKSPEVFPSSDTMAPSGSSAPTIWQTPSAVSGPVGSAGVAAAWSVAASAGAARHDWLCLTGGAIGQGLPVAVGAAVASPGRRVVALQADGSAMYTLQAWWTMAREQLDVGTVLVINSSYAVLNMELQRVGATAGGEKAKAMLDLHGPDLDFVALASGMGLAATRATTCEELVEQLREAFAHRGPRVIEAIVPSIV